MLLGYYYQLELQMSKLGCWLYSTSNGVPVGVPVGDWWVHVLTCPPGCPPHPPRCPHSSIVVQKQTSESQSSTTTSFLHIHLLETLPVCTRASQVDPDLSPLGTPGWSQVWPLVPVSCHAWETLNLILTGDWWRNWSTRAFVFLNL